MAELEYITCQACGYSLCHIDRTYDNCMCGAVIPEELKLDFEFQLVSNANVEQPE